MKYKLEIYTLDVGKLTITQNRDGIKIESIMELTKDSKEQIENHLNIIIPVLLGGFGFSISIKENIDESNKESD